MKNPGRSFEDDFADETRGKRTPMSGAQCGENDNIAGAFSCELKHTSRDRFTLTPALWAKALHRAKTHGMLPSFNVRMKGGYRIAILRDSDFMSFVQTPSYCHFNNVVNKHGNYVIKASVWSANEKEAKDWLPSLDGVLVMHINMVVGGRAERLIGTSHDTFLQIVEASREANA
jgi:hypothetical protein